MNGQILITGGAGFIGCHLARRLRDRYKIIIFDSFHRDSLKFAPELRADDRISIVQGDVLDPSSLEQAMQGCSIVLHLAAIAGVSSYYAQALKTLQVNIFGTINVLDAALKTGVRRIIDFSTSEVYGADAERVNEESVHRIGPVSQRRWVYAVSKLVSEHFTLRYGEQHALLCTCVRPFNIYGPGQTGEGAIRNFAVSLLNGEPITIYGDGTDVRAWCYIDDFVDGILLILENPKTIGLSFNIGNPAEPVSTKALADLIIRAVGKGRVNYAASAHDSINYRSPDISRAKEMLGFSPKVSLCEGLAKSVEWYGKTSLG